eukprot:Skav219652  [mRNA]  locus=scaffold628:447612:448205:- [translate_table: standard]
MYTEENRLKELNNGRMAMMSVLGIFAAEMVSGKDAMQQFGLQAIGHDQLRSSGSTFAGKTSAPAGQSALTRRAFQPSQQIGASEPLGFFDPLQFTKEGDEQGFKKLRASEIKHGRFLIAVEGGPNVNCLCSFHLSLKAPPKHLINCLNGLMTPRQNHLWNTFLDSHFLNSKLRRAMTVGSLMWSFPSQMVKLHLGHP